MHTGCPVYFLFTNIPNVRYKLNVMNTLRTIFTMLALTGVLQATAQDSIMKLSLRQSCQLGIEKNVNVKNAGLEKRKSQYQLSEAKSMLYPKIEAYSQFSYYFAIPKMILPGEIFGQTGLIPVEIGTKFDWSTGIKASQVIYSQSYFTSLKLAQSMETINDLNLQQKKEEMVYQVSQLYYLCQITKEQVTQLEITMQNTNKLLDIAKLQNDNGIIRKVDYSRVLVNKTNLQTQIDNLEQLYQQQLGLLKYIIGIELSTKVELSDSLTFSSTEIPTEIPDLTRRTELKLLDKQLEQTSLSLKTDKQSNLPTLSAFGQYYYQGQRNKFDYFEGGDDKFFKVGLIGLSLNIPIFDGFEKRSKIKQKNIELEQLENTRKSTIDFLSKDYEDATRQYKNSKNALQSQEENIKVAEETYNISLQGYQQQVVALSDLLMSESSLVEARLSYLNALLQLKNSELDLKKAKGELLNESNQ
jgi:outer membrane protein